MIRMKTELIRGKEQRLEEMTLVPAEAVRSIRNAAEDNNYGSVNEVF